MKEIMATIRLAPGRVGFYDPLSRIHLSLSRPETYVYSGTNCAQLRRAVKDGILRLMNGTLGEDVPPFKIAKVGNKFVLRANTAEEMKPVFAEKQAAKAAAPVEEVPVAVKEPAAEAPAEEPEEPVEEVSAEAEPAAEEAVEEKAKTKTKKAASKKKAAK